MTQRFDYMDFIPPHNRLKPRFAALAEAVLAQANDLFTLLDSQASACSLDEAVGIQLDTIGMMAGIPRPPDVSDANYRLYLQARLAARQWDGTNETLPAILARAFPERTATLVDNQNGTVTASLSGDAPPFPLSDLFPVAAGIRLETN